MTSIKFEYVNSNFVAKYNGETYISFDGYPAEHYDKLAGSNIYFFKRSENEKTDASFVIIGKDFEMKFTRVGVSKL